MHTPLAFISGSSLLWAGLLFGFIFGVLLHRGGVTAFNVIVKQFLFRDFTVLKVMFTAIVVGGVGLFILHGQELSNWHIKPAHMLAVILGALLFGIGMVIYGYCPGTGIAAIATGKLDALVGFLGMLAGAAAYALCYDWIAANILPVADLGKKRLPDLTTLPEWVWYAGLVVMAAVVFALVARFEKTQSKSS
ncbi:MAG: hypothetical protein B7Z37_18720 [Verrucomicrobia bacterium 12-59-8]|nr:MAG: hypothetical protein B7Z37_18720 [Verrucomicrobia bacterium 12-59-8]